MTIDRGTLRWNGWGPVKQENPLPGAAPPVARIDATPRVSLLPSPPAAIWHPTPPPPPPPP